MLITVQEFKSAGLPVATDIKDAEIQMAITTIEEYYLKPRILDANYIDLTNNPTEAINYILLNGGVIDDVRFAGLKNGLYHLVYAYLVMDEYRLTRFASVEKTSEFSKTVGREDLEDNARIHWNVGIAFVKELQNYYGINNNECIQNTLFESIVI